MCPLVPVAGITLEECAVLARKLGERFANELEIPCYLYEAAAQTEERKNLAVCRRGEYEKLAERLGTEDGPTWATVPLTRRWHARAAPLSAHATS